MIWFRDLLLGFFTRHLATKLLALLLSVGLFGFVQASLTGTQEVRQLTLRFNLAEELRDEYVLLTDELVFGGLTMTGMRSKVDPLARLYKGNSVVNLAIDQRFLNVYGEAFAAGIRVRIDRDLFADDRLFGRDIVVGNLPGGLDVVLDKIDTRTARVEVAPDMPTAIPPDVEHEYEGRIALSFNVKNVTIEGPASAFTGEPAVLVSVPDIVNKLSRYQVAGERGEAKLSPVEIRWKGIATERLPLLRISAGELGGDPMSVRDFQQRLVASCPVTKRKMQKSLQGVPIEIRYPLPRQFDLVEDWDVFPSAFVNRDLKEGRMQQLDVRLPAGLVGNQDFLSNLVVVLDVGAATADPATTPDSMFVPFYLDLKDRSREEDVLGLDLVEIVNRAPAEFRKKTK